MLTKIFHPKTGETNTKYACSCTENYHGTNCKHEYNQYDDDEDAFKPIGAILGIVLTAVLIAIIIVIISLRYCCTKKKKIASSAGNKKTAPSKAMCANNTTVRKDSNTGSDGIMNERDDVDVALDAEEASLPYWKKVID